VRRQCGEVNNKFIMKKETSILRKALTLFELPSSKDKPLEEVENRNKNRRRRRSSTF
jgi:hypothetical protein